MKGVTYTRSPESQQRMISFAQNHEDVLIDRVFQRQTGFFIDVGAFHPVFDSVTKYFSLAGWRGINVEPCADVFGELSRDRPNDINLNCAVSSSRGVVILHQLANKAMSTISPGHLAELGPAYHGNHQRIEVEARTLADICTEFVTGDIDFLTIDVEGSEADVIKGADWMRFRPRLVVIEATKPWSSELNCENWEPYLLSQGYIFCHFDGINRYYLRREDADLAGQLSVPVNVLDSYITYPELRVRQQNAEQQSEIQRLCQLLAAPRA